MKLIAIALKDIGRSFRSLFALVFMFGVPVLTTLIFAFLFGGVGGESDEFELPKTSVVIVNQDKGSNYLPVIENQNRDLNSFGNMLVNILQEDTFMNLIDVGTADEKDAREMVDAQEVGLAIIVPPEFTETLIGVGPKTLDLIFYKDPEMALGPQVVQALVMGIVDRFSASSISMETINTVLAEEALTLSDQEVYALYSKLSETVQISPKESESGMTIIAPQEPGDSEESPSMLSTILREIMGGMMIFYAFFTGTSAAQSILIEQEQGTLARLFITPTNTQTILNGKFTSGFILVIVQVVTLMVFSRLVFGINWGSILPLFFFVIALVALANSFGIFLMSLVRGTKQAGIVFGAGLTFFGMLGISGVFTGGTPIESAFKYLPLLAPQGWAMKSLESAFSNNQGQSLLFSGGMILLTAIFLLIGNKRFKKRFK
jgi:ABC-2 type transport system permease protein